MTDGSTVLSDPSPEPDSGSPPRRRRGRSWRFRLTVLAIGVLGGLVLGEVAYRIKLAVGVGETPLGVGTTFHAWSEATVRDDPVAGYRHEPDRRVVGVRVANGRAVLSLERTSNAAGVIGPSESGTEQALTRILVVGDSFTENQRQGTTWPALMQTELGERIDGTVSVISRARSGHGLLQMIDVAADVARESQFDVVVVAFISDDLNRARFWQQTRSVDGEPRLVTRLSRDSQGWLALSEFYDARIDADWCRRMVETGGVDDEVIADLVSRFESRKRDNPRRIDYASLASSFLFNRLVYGDPFFGIEGIAATPRFSWWDFRRDPGVVGALEELRSLKANVVLVHLPQYEELAAGAYRMSDQQQSLLRSLEQLAGVPAVNLIERGDVPTRPKSLYLLPVDHHPSREGLEWYAGAVAGVLEQMMTAADPDVNTTRSKTNDWDGGG